MAEGVERMVSAALSAIQNEQRAGRERNLVTFSDDDDFTEGSSHRSASLYRETVKHFSPNGKTTSKQRGRPTKTAEMSMFLLEEPSQQVPTKTERKRLNEKGLGDPKNESDKVFLRAWNIDQVYDHICSAYPGASLALVGFDLARASKLRILTRIEFETVANLKKTIGKGKLYIIPKRRLQNSRLDEVWGELEEAGGVSEDKRDEAKSSNEETSSNEESNEELDQEESQMAVEDTEYPTENNQAEGLQAEVSRSGRFNRRRLAARSSQTAARQRIRTWCNNMTRGNAVESPVIVDDDQNSASQGIIASTSAVNSVTGAAVDNQGQTLRQIRQQQDDAYLASLRADQEKDRQRQQEERRAQQERDEREALQQLRTQLQLMRRRNLPLESDSGFILKIRGGPQRRFCANDKVKILINFVGSIPEATKDFIIKIAGTDTKICSWILGDQTLEQLGINSAAVLELNWNADRPDESESVDAYEALMATIESDVNLEEEEDMEDVMDQNGQSGGSEDIRDILIKWRLETIKDDIDDPAQTIRVTRNKESLFKHALHCFQRGSFDIKKVLKVEFRNESGQDEGGLRREFFEILLKQIISSSLFEETDQGFDVTKNMVALIENKYCTVGKMIASMLIQGGAVQPIFSHTLIQYGRYGAASISKDTLREDKKDIIEKVEKDSLSTLMVNDDVLACLEEAGITSAMTEASRQPIIKALTAFYTQQYQRQTMYDQFWEGAEMLGLRTLLKGHGDQIEKILCKKCGRMPHLTADGLISIIVFDKHGEEGSNDRRLSEEIQQNFESFIFDCEDKKCGDLKVGDILKFMTGCSTLPPAGLEKMINVHFVSIKKFPFVSTCTLDMTLPVYLTDYNCFKETMIECIVSGQGFGAV